MVCFEEDDYTRGRFITDPRWLVRLSNGQTIIDDDGRPGTTESSWLRLKTYLSEHDVRIENLAIQFRGEVRNPVPPNAEGYFFRKAVGAFLNDDIVFNFFLVGYLRHGKVRVTRWRVPDLVQVEREVRDPDDVEKVGESLIT